MDADVEAQQHVDLAGTLHRADLLAAFWNRLKEHRIPPAVRREWAAAEFHTWPIDDS